MAIVSGTNVQSTTSSKPTVFGVQTTTTTSSNPAPAASTSNSKIVSSPPPPAQDPLNPASSSVLAMESAAGAPTTTGGSGVAYNPNIASTPAGAAILANSTGSLGSNSAPANLVGGGTGGRILVGGGTGGRIAGGIGNNAGTGSASGGVSTISSGTDTGGTSVVPSAPAAPAKVSTTSNPASGSMGTAAVYDYTNFGNNTKFSNQDGMIAVTVNGITYVTNQPAPAGWQSGTDNLNVIASNAAVDQAYGLYTGTGGKLPSGSVVNAQQSTASSPLGASATPTVNIGGTTTINGIQYSIGTTTTAQGVQLIYTPIAGQQVTREVPFNQLTDSSGVAFSPTGPKIGANPGIPIVSTINADGTSTAIGFGSAGDMTYTANGYTFTLVPATESTPAQITAVNDNNPSAPITLDTPASAIALGQQAAQVGTSLNGMGASAPPYIQVQNGFTTNSTTGQLQALGTGSNLLSSTSPAYYSALNYDLSPAGQAAAQQQAGFMAQLAALAGQPQGTQLTQGDINEFLSALTSGQQNAAPLPFGPSSPRGASSLGSQSSYSNPKIQTSSYLGGTSLYNNSSQPARDITESLSTLQGSAQMSDTSKSNNTGVIDNINTFLQHFNNNLKSEANNPNVNDSTLNLPYFEKQFAGQGVELENLLGGKYNTEIAHPFETINNIENQINVVSNQLPNGEEFKIVANGLMLAPLITAGPLIAAGLGVSATTIALGILGGAGINSAYTAYQNSQSGKPITANLVGSAIAGAEGGAIASPIEAIKIVKSLAPFVDRIASYVPEDFGPLSILAQAAVKQSPNALQSALKFGVFGTTLVAVNAQTTGQKITPEMLLNAFVISASIGAVIPEAAAIASVLPTATQGLARLGTTFAAGAGIGAATGQNPLLTGALAALPGAEDFGPRVRVLQGQGVDVGALTFKVSPQDEIGLLNVVYTPDGWRIGSEGEEAAAAGTQKTGAVGQLAEFLPPEAPKLGDVVHLGIGTPSAAQYFAKPQLNEAGEPISLFPETKGFKATKTPGGESSDLLTTPFGRRILEKTIADIKDAAPTDAAYAKAWLNVVRRLSSGRYPSASEFKIALEGRTPEENEFITNLVKKYRGQIQELRGSVGSKMQMLQKTYLEPKPGEPNLIETPFGNLDADYITPATFKKYTEGEPISLFPRDPHDIDPVFSNTEQMENFVKEAAEGLNKIGAHTYEIDPSDKGLLNTVENGAKGHIINAKAQDQPESYDVTKPTNKTPLGEPHNAARSVEGVRVQSVAQSLKEKVSSALSLRLFDEADIARAPAEWQKFLNEYKKAVGGNVIYGRLTPLQDGFARLATREGGYIGGSGAIKVQMPDGSFREAGDSDLYTNDKAKVGDLMDKALRYAKDYYAANGLDSERLTISPTSSGDHQVIFDTETLKPVADIIYRPVRTSNPNFIPDKVITTKDGIRAREVSQIIKDKAQAVRVATKTNAISSKGSSISAREASFLEKNAQSISEAKIAKATKDINLYKDAQFEFGKEGVQATFAPNDWRIKDVIDPYFQAKYLNRFNSNPFSRGSVDESLEAAKQASIKKFGLKEEDFNDGVVDLTPLLNGGAAADGVANADLLFRTVAPVPAQETALAAQNPAQGLGEPSALKRPSELNNASQQPSSPPNAYLSKVPSLYSSPRAPYGSSFSSGYGSSPYSSEYNSGYNSPYSSRYASPSESPYSSPYQSGYSSPYTSQYSSPYTSPYTSTYGYQYPYGYYYGYPPPKKSPYSELNAVLPRPRGNNQPTLQPQPGGITSHYAPSLVSLLFPEISRGLAIPAPGTIQRGLDIRPVVDDAYSDGYGRRLAVA